MPLPLFLGIAAGIAAAGGVGSGIHGAIKMKDANDTMKYAEERHNQNMLRFKTANTKTTKCMDSLGKKELEILASFEKFSELFEKIQNKPEFEDVTINGNILPKYDGEELKKVSVGACALMGCLGGAALGTAGGFAAAGATTAAVMALGTASTGTAIASLSGVAATNATLAALGGGAIAAGGGGIALGTTILGVSTAGVGLLVGGVIFNITGSSISKKADEAYSQMKKAEAQIDEICQYLKELEKTATKYNQALCDVESLYHNHLFQLEELVNKQNKIDWMTYSEEEKLLVQNTILFVGLLYKMCKVQLVLKSNTGINKINYVEIDKIHNTAEDVILEFSDNNVSKLSVDDENLCIATIAVISYFAKVDGNVSNEEKELLQETIDNMINEKNISNTARREINEIVESDIITFDKLTTYLDKISIEKVVQFKDLIENVISASDGLTEQEAKAKEKFNAYIVIRN